MITALLEAQNLWLPWLPLIGVLLGGLLTGGFACLTLWLQRRHQKQQERNKLYREKLQELYEVVSAFKNSYRQTTGSAAISLAGRRPLTDVGPPVPVEKLQMLVGFYAPSLQPHLTKLLGSGEQYSEVLVRRVGLERQPDAAIKSFVGDLHKKGQGINENAEEMQRAIVELSKEYI